MAVQVTPLFSPTQLAASVGTIYAMPTSPTTLALAQGMIRFTNTSAGSRAITWYAVPSGGTAGASNCQMNAEALAANAHVDISVPVLGPGGSIQAFADAANDVTISCLGGNLFS